MGDAAPTGAGPLRGLRIAFRVVLALALVVLLVLIGVKQAPKVLAAIAPAGPTTAVAQGASTAPVVVAPTGSTTPAPTVDVPSITLPPVSSGGGGGATASTPTNPAPVVTALSAADVKCPMKATGAPDAPAAPNPEVTVRWSTSGGSKAWFGIGTSDAQAAPYDEEPLSGAVTLDFPCTTSSQLYTVTVVGAGGKASRSITVRNVGAVG